MNALERAFRRSDMIREVVKAAGAGSGVLGDSGALGAVGMGSSKMAHAKEQEGHNFGWVHAAIRVIAQRIAGQPLRVAKRAASGAPNGRLKNSTPTWSKAAPPWVKRISAGLELVEDHPLLRAVADPNEVLTGYSLLYVTVFQLELTGVSYWWMRPEGDRLTIWPLPSSWCKPNHDGRPFSSVTVTPRYSSEQFDVPGEEICRLHYPDPTDPVFGAYSPLQGNAAAVVTDEHLQQTQARHFLNGVFPAFAFIVGRQPDVNGNPGERPALSKEQRAQIALAVKQAYRGSSNAGEPLILDRIIEDVKRISNTAAEMDFIGSAGLTKERITQGFGVNPIVMGQVEGANRSSSATADDHLCKSTVNPKIALISQCITQWVAPHFGEDTVAFIEEAKASDPDQDRADREQLAKYGAITRNELRQAVGMEAIDGGDELIEASPAPFAFDAGGAAGFAARTFRVLGAHE